MLAKIKNNEIIKFPYNNSDLQEENPYTIFGTGDIVKDFQGTESNLRGEELISVEMEPAPTYDIDTQRIDLDNNPVFSNGKWTVGWTIINKTPEEIASEVVAKRQVMVVSPFQAKAALLQAGLLTQVETLINDPATDPLVKLAWNNASEYRRLSSMIVNLAAKLNLTNEQLDELFDNAAKITA